MPEIIPNHVPSPRTLLAWDGTAYRPIHIDAAGNVQVDVLASALPAGAATEATLATRASQATLAAFAAAAATAANQATMITALQLIDDLRNALNSVGTDELDVNVEASVLPLGAADVPNQALMIASLQDIDNLVHALWSVDTDRLIVRGEDQLFSYDRRLASHRIDTVSGAGGFVDSNSPAAGEIWVVTNIGAYDVTSPTTAHSYSTPEGVDLIRFHRQTEAFGVNTESEWSGHLYLEENDVVRVYFAGSLAGDTCHVQLTGYVMTLET